MLRRSRRILLLAAGIVAILVLLTATRFLGGRGGRGDGRDGQGAAAGPDLAGRVRTASGDAPPEGTCVLAHGPEEPLRALTDADGAFRFDELPAGVTELEVVAGPLRARVEAGSFAGEIRLPREFDAAGKVVEAETGEPVAGAEIVCGARRASTDERGRFRLEGVEAPDGRAPPVEVRSVGHHPDLYLRLLKR
jgi:hypothetical protein